MPLSRCARPWRVPARLALVVVMATVAVAAPARTLKVGFYDNPPKLTRTSTGEPGGSFVELLQAIARAEGWTLQWQECRWAQCLERLERGELDLMPDVALTADRQTRFDFHVQPAMLSWSQLYRAPAVTIGSVLDLDGRRVAVLRDSAQAGALQGMLQGFALRVTLVPVDSLAEAFAAVAQGGADAAAANVHFGDYHMNVYGLRATPVVFNPSRLYFAAPRGRHGDVLAAIDRHLLQWGSDPSSPYHEIMRRWATPQGVVRLPAWAWPALGGLAGVALLFGGVSLWLRRRVHQATEELRRSERRYRELTETINDVIWTLDPVTMRFTYVSPAVQRLRGHTPEEIVGQPLESALTPESAVRVRALLARRLADFEASGRSQSEPAVLELAQPRKDGGVVWTEVVSTLVRRPEDGRVEVLGVTRDITERRAAQARIEQLARYDQLTGLPNREHLRQQLRALLAAARLQRQALAVLMVDLDHFKTVNEAQGLGVGDALLGEVAQRLQAGCGPRDLVARMAGDEFALVLTDVDAQGAMQRAQALLEAISRPCRIAGGEIGLGATIGIALFPDDGDDPDELMRRAEAAMHQAKQTARHSWRFYTPALQHHSDRLLRLSTALAQALPRGELRLQYQPQVSLRDGRIVGAEALLRWRHPGLGEVAPAEFIPVAESSGRIVEIGDWVLREAVAAARRWVDLPQAPYVAVNVSVPQLLQPDFAARVRELTARAGLPPQRLELEVTESVAAGGLEDARRTLRSLVEAGFAVAIDDFGTGYSSLAYLRRLGFARLKIDRVFVQDIGRDADDEAIIRAIVQLAHTLGLSTIAEGVETVEQARFLAEAGCDVMQGWLFCAALDEADFVTLVRKHDAAGWHARWLATPAAA
ncbi:putative signaling protein [Tepidimonas sediminis]|uniref:Putative signaling protein n=1 Tax=Tepidimonas sediminis TaxID=2588941 RepID=A0A554WUS4_9BURK|nr:EAL domain-containing protein [Tepidimonas sediminis]TSE27328.1 putative signaling protein [Tepidimonas sediminis]